MRLPGTSTITGLARYAGNVAEYLRHGGLETGEESSPYETVARGPVLKLRHYFHDSPPSTSKRSRRRSRTPILLVPPLMLSADVWDVSPSTSAVAHLHSAGLDPWVVDFGDPDHETDGRRRTVTDHVLAVSDAIEEVARVTGRPVHIGGYSQGGLFCYQAAAYRRSEDVASIFALGSPMEPLSIPGLDLPEELMGALTRFTTEILSHTGLPGWAAANLFAWTSPVATAKQRLQYLGALRDREALLPREKQRRFLGGDGWITFPGPSIADVMDSMTNERFVRGGLVFGDRAVSLSDVSCPILIFTGQYDAFAPPRAVRDVVKGVPHADVWECTMPTGHFGLGVGGRANRTTWPTVTHWAGWVDGDRPAPPDGIRDARSVAEDDRTRPSSTVRATVNLATHTLLATPHVIEEMTGRLGSTVSEISRDAVDQLPRLIRLEQVTPSSKISYGSLLTAGADHDPGAIALLYRGRAYTRSEIDSQVDEAVARLVSAGVRRGEHVGVRCESGSTLLVTAAALSRIGAVGVLLRPDTDLALQLKLGRAHRVVVDDTDVARELTDLVDDAEVLLVGAAHRAASPAPPKLIDLRGVRADSVRMPGWYRPNPGRGRDLAFIVVTDTRDGLRPMPITNRKWALSALGAASAAGLTSSDTVYSANPLHHPSGLLLATAAPVAVGARLALTDSFDPSTFWEDVRAYGATTIPYTWDMLHLLLRQPVRPEERHHPVRVFIGSGMSTATWRGVLDRFAPATVIEIFAPARTEAILANPSGSKVGSVGKPLPGTARVAVGAIHPTGEDLATDADGFVARARPGQVGRLLVEVRREHPLWDDVPLRGVFERGDAWVDTGELFACDGDGDLWPRGRAGTSDVVAGVSMREVEDAFSVVPGVDHVTCLNTSDGPAVVLASPDDVEVAKGNVDDVLATLPAGAAPIEIRFRHTVPMTRWFRPDRAAMAADA